MKVRSLVLGAVALYAIHVVCAAANRPAHLETIGNLVFEEDAIEHSISVEWTFPALNRSVVEMPADLPDRKQAQMEVDLWLERSNARMLKALENRLPPIQTHGSRSKRAVPILYIVAGAGAGFAGGMAGGILSHVVASSGNAKQVFREDAILRALEDNFRFYELDRIREYSQLLDNILNPAYRPLVINENRIAEALHQHAGSGHIVDVDVTNIVRHPPSAGNLISIEGLVTVRSAASDHPLQRVHVGGHFTPSQRMFLTYSMEPFWIRHQRDWLQVDRSQCTVVDMLNATICRRGALSAHDKCNPETVVGCKVTAETVTSPFVHFTPMAQSIFIGTTAHKYVIKNVSGSFEFTVPEGGTFYLSTSANSEVIVGTERRPGVGVVHQVFHSKTKIHVTPMEEEEIKAETTYIAAVSGDQIKLQEFTFLNGLANWLSANWASSFIIAFVILLLLVIVGFYACHRYQSILRNLCTVNLQHQAPPPPMPEKVKTVA